MKRREVAELLVVAHAVIDLAATAWQSSQLKPRVFEAAAEFGTMPRAIYSSWWSDGHLRRRNRSRALILKRALVPGHAESPGDPRAGNGATSGSEE